MTAVEPALLGLGLAVLPARSSRLRLLHRELGTPPSPVPATRWREQLGSPPLATVLAASFGAVIGGPLLAIPVAVATFWWARRAHRRTRSGTTNPLELAAGWDLLSAGMRAGLPVVVIVRAVAAEFSGTARDALREVAGLLELGADPVSAWEPALRHPATAELGRAARRTARTGSALAEVAAELAAEARKSVADRAQARAQRAAVWVTAPLGLCFLPAFLCLGVVPVVVGMLQRLAESW